MSRSLHILVSFIGRFSKLTPWSIIGWTVLVMFINYFILKFFSYLDIGFAFIFKYVCHLTAYYWQHFISITLNMIVTIYFVDVTLYEYRNYQKEKQRATADLVGILKLARFKRQFIAALFISSFSVLACVFIAMQHNNFLALSMFIVIWTQTFVIENVAACRRYFQSLHLKMDAETVAQMNDNLRKRGYMTFEFHRGEDDHLQKDFLVRCSDDEYAEIHAFLNLYTTSNRETIKFLIKFMHDRYFVTDQGDFMEVKKVGPSTHELHPISNDEFAKRFKEFLKDKKTIERSTSEFLGLK